MGVTRLWITWGGIIVFVALIFSVSRDWARYRRFGPVTTVLVLAVVAALVALFLLPRV